MELTGTGVLPAFIVGILMLIIAIKEDNRCS